MAFRIAPLRIPNMTTDYSAEINSAAQLGKTIAGMPGEWRKQEEAAQKKQLLGSLLGGTPDYTKIGLGLIAAGDTAGGASVIGLGQKQKEIQQTEDAYKNSPFSSSAPASVGARPTATLGTPNDIENTFVGTVRQAGLTNPVGLGAVAAYGKAESGFSPNNVNRVWNDPSESGQPGQSGGIMSWRGPRLEALNAFARERGEQQASPQTQALFLAKEDPTLIPRLNEAKTPQEANQIMANAWRFAGYNRPGGENARREALTTQYAQRYAGQGGQPQQAGQPAPQGVQVAETEADVQRLEAGMPNYGVGQPTQTAQAPIGAGGVYAGVDEGTLNGYLNNPNVPPNLKALVQQELAGRQGGGAPQAPGAPVQMAEAAPQPGTPVADMPVQNGSPVESRPDGFRVPQTLPPNDPYPNLSNEQVAAIALNPKHPHRAFAADLWKSRRDYAAENAPDKREKTRLETRKTAAELAKLERENAGKGFRILNSQERAEAGIPADYKGVVQIDRDGQLHFPGKASTSVEVKTEGSIPPGYQVRRDEQGRAVAMEPIPGGPADEKAKAAEEKARLTREQTQTTGNVVLTALDDIDRLMKEATLPTTGAIGSRVADIKGTAAFDIKSALTTIGANISFDKLSQMRAASPTGGALGAVTENELKLLENSMAALQQAQSEGQFKANLGRVRANFERIVHGRTLTPQERKADGPMTAERAKSLRDEAKAAISGGAPREEVAKRLKEKYGITPEAL